MKLSATDYNTIRNALRVIQPEVPYKGVWKRLKTDFGYGERHGEVLRLSAAERRQIAEKVKAMTGSDPRYDSLEDRMNETRSKVDTRTDEKWQSLPPRAPYLEVRDLNSAPNQGFRGCHVSALLKEITSAPPALVLTVENFDTFISLTPAQMQMALPQQTAEQTLVMYRGDSKASPKAVSTFLAAIRGRLPLAHFPDFDPAGISTGLALQPDHLVLPRLTGLAAQLDKLQRRDKFDRQRNLVDHMATLSDRHPHLRQHITYMMENRCAPQQEAMVQLGMGLELVSCSETTT